MLIEDGDKQPHISHEISLSDFIPHPDDTEPSHYTRACRCSGQFCITLRDLEGGVEVVGCEGCGEWIRVAYEVVEDE